MGLPEFRQTTRFFEFKNFCISKDHTDSPDSGACVVISMEALVDHSSGEYYAASTEACNSGAIGVTRLGSEGATSLALVAYGDGSLSVVQAIDADERVVETFEFPPPADVCEAASLAAAAPRGEAGEYMFASAAARVGGGYAARVSVLDAERGTLRDALIPLVYPATAVAVEGRQARVACGSANGHINVWDMNIEVVGASGGSPGRGASPPSLRETRMLAQGVGPHCHAVAFWPYSEENLVAAG